MTPEQRHILHDLLATERVLALALVVDGEPHAGLLPFALAPDRAALLVHASRLARHARGLVPGAAFSALVHRADRGDADPLQLPRVTLEGTVVPIPRDAPAWPAARDAYLARLPSAAVTFQLGDFGLHALRIEGGRLVAGFAQAVNVAPADVAG
jgi:putative heme iron utilization protein